jgi:hypothetical protein
MARLRRSRSAPAAGVPFAIARAWSRRPYGFRGTAAEAVALLEEAERAAAALAAASLAPCAMSGVQLRRSHSDDPTLCYRHDHPLRTGAHNRLYERHDYITPIFDSLDRMSGGGSADDPLSSARGTPPREPCGDDERLSPPRPRSACVLDPRGEWRCGSCDRALRTCTEQRADALVCACGAVVCAHGALVSTHRERLGADACDDRTQHADAPVAVERDRFDRAPPSARERVAAARADARATRVPARARGALARAQFALDERARLERGALDDPQLHRVLAALEVLFEFVGQGAHGRARSCVPFELQRAMRIHADRLWTHAVAHSAVCSRACRLRALCTHSSRVIANAIFDDRLERAVAAGDDDADVHVTRLDRSHLLGLREHVRALRQNVTPSARGGVETARSYVEALWRDLQATHERGGAQRACAAPWTAREDARERDDALVVALHRVFGHMGNELARAVRARALAALGSPALVARLRDAVGARARNDEACALLLLLALDAPRPARADDARRRELQAARVARLCGLPATWELLSPWVDRARRALRP